LFHRERANLHARGGRARLDLIAVEQNTRARAQKPEMAVHRVLVQGDQNIELVAHVPDGAIAGADGEERMAAADEGLVGVIRV